MINLRHNALDALDAFHALYAIYAFSALYALYDLWTFQIALPMELYVLLSHYYSFYTTYFKF